MTLDLSRPRRLNELLDVAIGLFERHFTVFFTLTLAAVAPTTLLFDGIWGRTLRDGYGNQSATSSLVGSLVQFVVVTPLVTSLHVTVVVGLAEGEEPQLGTAWRGALSAFPLAAAAIVLATAGWALGLVALIVPGLWLAVRWYFAGQAAVVDGVGAREALRRSAEVVDGRWWSTVGRLLLLGLLAFGLTLPLRAFQFVPGLRDQGLLYTLALIFATTITASFSALAGTLLFFDRRAVARG